MLLKKKYLIKFMKYLKKNKYINYDERIFVMLLILVLFYAMCPSLTKEKLWGVKQKNIPI